MRQFPLKLKAHTIWKFWNLLPAPSNNKKKSKELHLIHIQCISKDLGCLSLLSVSWQKLAWQCGDLTNQTHFHIHNLKVNGKVEAHSIKADELIDTGSCEAVPQSFVPGSGPSHLRREPHLKKTNCLELHVCGMKPLMFLFPADWTPTHRLDLQWPPAGVLPLP